MNRIITLTTDFGLNDGFVGTMKGVILTLNPYATIVDITHDIAPQNIEQGAFLFANALPYFPANAIHVVVVDPGVGTARRPIALQMGETIFVAPDNGVLTFAMTHHVPIHAVQLNRPAYWLPRVSRTFHGRDIFAPVAAHLSLGVPLAALGDPLDDWVRLEITPPQYDAEGAIIGKVIHVDRFGNLITNIPGEMIAGLKQARLEITGHELSGIRETYADAGLGEPLALVSSSGHLEIAVRDGNASIVLGAGIGNLVRVTP